MCTMVKYEERYIDEWIDYIYYWVLAKYTYRITVTNIHYEYNYIHNSINNNNLLNLINQNKIEIVHYPGMSVQRYAFTDCLSWRSSARHVPRRSTRTLWTPRRRRTPQAAPAPP